MPDASIGYASRISFAAAGTAIGSYTEAIEFVSESLAKRQEIVETAGIRGTRSHPSERTRDGTYSVGGDITFACTPALLDLMLPRILGANESTDTFAVADALPEFDVLVDRVAKRYVYAGCKVARARFYSTAGGILMLTMSLIGKTETASATSFPAITAPTDPPYVHHDVVVTLLSSARKVTDIEVVVDNGVQARFTNSQTATDVTARDRVVTVNATCPYTSDEVDLYGINTGSAAAATAVYTNGGYSLSFSFVKLQIPDNSPTIPGRGDEILLKLSGVARGSGSTKEIVTTSDSTA